MTSDMRLGMAQSFRTSRSSFTSNNGYESPSLNLASVSNREEYDSYGSNFAPPAEGFLRAMQKQIQSVGKRGFFFLSKRSAATEVWEKFTFVDMMCFQKDPIPTTILKINSDLVNRAVKLFQIVLKYMGVDSFDRVTPTRQYLIRAWELMYLCASCMPPSKDIGGYLSEYVHNLAHSVNTDPDIQVLALNT
ncbi:Kinesin-like protein KIN-14E [Camellia lanceoleosa]|uniref:Kinesin-like protein KIN-14E n=1 Tax=Camellia lanceoleosa TaxID=1840588 RepID=A0ACC0ITK3_9ERIC|nr:Kinesin-like protein KIN-14E [Camellia lanceoleosa]